MTHDDDPTVSRSPTALGESGPTAPGESGEPEESLQPDGRPGEPDGRPGEPDGPAGQPEYHVVHVERAFSAQPTLGDALGPSAVVHELPLAEVLAGDLRPDLIWASDATIDLVHLLHERFPDADILATLPRTASTRAVLDLLTEGADLVLRDEGILLAAAALHAMARRRRPRNSSADRPDRPASRSTDHPADRPRPHPGLPDPRGVDRTLTSTGI